MDFNNKKAIFGVFIVVLVLITAGFYFWRVKLLNPETFKPLNLETLKPLNETGDSAPNSSLIPSDSFSTLNSSLSPEKPEALLKIPDLDRPIKMSDTRYPTSTVTLDIQEVVGTLKGNYDYLDGWLQLGALRKMIGDYDGAIEAWEFAGVLRPKSAISFLNLADLYAFYVKNNTLAEKNFAKATSADPKNGFAYFQAARFYGDVLKDKEKAQSILRQGISAGADPTGDLQSLLDSLK